MGQPKYNGGVVKYDGTNVTVKCAFCGEHADVDVSDFTSNPNENSGTGQFENLSVQCATCNSITFVNLNIPEGDYDELDVEMEMPFHELNARKYVRDLMWDKRSDLKHKSRDAHNKRNKSKLEAFQARQAEKERKALEREQAKQ